VGAGLTSRFGNAVEDIDTFVFDAALARRHTTDNLRAVLHGLQRVECSFSSGESLNQKPRVLINQYAHDYLFPVAATTFSAASFIPSATMKFNPEVRRISCPCSTFVPSSRTTIGI